jgi:hypothetical protein
MEGIKRLRLIPSYFSEFSFKSEEKKTAKEPILIRTPENFKSLTEKVINHFNFPSFSMTSEINSEKVLISDEKTYNTLIQTSKTKIINIRLSKSDKKSRKIKKPKQNLPFSLIFSKSSSLRTLKFTNILTRHSKDLKSDLFSMTSRSISHGSKVYLIGGRKDPRQVLVVDAVSWEISQGPQLNIGRYWCSVTVFEGKIAVVGGVKGEKLEKNALSEVEVLEENGWSHRRALNLPRADASSAYFKETVFVFCGTFYEKGKIRPQRSLERWNGNTWELLALRCSFIYNAGLLALSSQTLLVFGGTSDQDEELASVFEYDVEIGFISKKDSLRKRDYFTSGQSCRLDNSLYLLGSLHGITEISLDL